MILDLIAQLRQRNIVLASASPRRKELLETVVGLTPRIVPSTFAEDLPHGDYATAADYAVATATCKGREVFQRVARGDGDGGGCADLVIACDSVVAAPDGRIFEKARDADHAAAMIRDLSGKAHTVSTALILLFRTEGCDEPTVVACSETTKVLFADVSEAEVASYVSDSARWAGKAGAYGIQDAAAAFIRGIEGDYYTVMGFPVHRFCAEVRRAVDGAVLRL